MVRLAPLSFQLIRFSPFFSVRRVSTFLSPFKPQNGGAWTRGQRYCVSSAGVAVEASEFEFEEVHDDAKEIEKDSALRSALSRIADDFGRESKLSLHRFFGARRAAVVSTGSLRLDQALGIGGLPKGRIVELYGREASGKTTLALHIVKEAQKLGGYCAYLDVENALDPLLVESIGVDTENLLISQPDSAENLLSVVNTLTKSGSVDVIVVDSVAALVPQLELDAPVGGTGRDIQSRIMTQALRKIHYSLCNSRALIIFINQVRANVTSSSRSMHADEVTCGGNALPFYAAVRMRLTRKGLLMTQNKATGLGICVQVVKNKLAPAMTKVELKIRFGKGICCESEVLELACQQGIVLKEGSNYFIEGEVFSGKDEAENYLAANDEVRDKIVKTLRAQLFARE